MLPKSFIIYFILYSSTYNLFQDLNLYYATGLLSSILLLVGIAWQ